MFRTVALALAALAPLAAHAADRRYSVTDFDRVVVEGPYIVQLTVGGTTSAIASGDPRALDLVSVEVQGTTLRIRRNSNAWGADLGRPVTPATIRLTSRTLRSAGLAGTGSLEISGARGLNLQLLLAGSGRLAATNLAFDNLALDARGSGTVELAGAAKTVTAQVQGTATLQGSALASETVTLAAATASDIALTARRSANVTATGLGRVTISGGGACTLNGPRADAVTCGAAR